MSLAGTAVQSACANHWGQNKILWPHTSRWDQRRSI